MVRARWLAVGPFAWAVLACGNGMPIDLGQEFQAPMEDPPSADIPEFPAGVKLTGATERAVVNHLELLFHAESGEAPFCEALDNARTLAATLERHLNDVATEDAAFDAAVGQLDALIPGVGFRVGSEGVSGWHAPNQLAGYTDGNSRALLEASAEVLPHPFPGWMEQTTDLGGCNEPGRVAEPLQRVAERWSLAAGCVRGSMKEPLRATLKTMVAQDCYCRSRSETMSMAEDLKKPLGLLPDIGGNQVLSALRKAMTGPDARYKDGCGG